MKKTLTKIMSVIMAVMIAASCASVAFAEEEVSYPYNCPDCGDLIENMADASVHSMLCESYVCDVCGETFSYIVGVVHKMTCGYELRIKNNPGETTLNYGDTLRLSADVFYVGEKLDDKTTALIEAYIDGNLGALGVAGDDLPLATKERIGCIQDYSSGRNRYLGYLISLASHSYKNLKIGLDCANGASWMIANSVFSALGAHTTVIGAEPDGLNVNENCGSTHIENLCKLVKENHLDVGFAFDGDADRCIAVDGNGEVVDGDKMLYILGKRLKSRGMLNHDTVVATVMSNSGFFASLEEAGMKCEQTNVGDRFVYECMQEKGYALGGEQSGHIIIKKYATTGDGILTAIMIAEEICDSKRSLAELAAPVMLYPQYTKNVKVKDKAAVFKDKDVADKLAEVEKLIDGKGRALLRQSGTEPVVRVMIESETEEKCIEYAQMIADTILKGGHGIE